MREFSDVLERASHGLYDHLLSHVVTGTPSQLLLFPLPSTLNAATSQDPRRKLQQLLQQMRFPHSSKARGSKVLCSMAIAVFK